MPHVEGTNATGQVPSLDLGASYSGLIDRDTPQSAHTIEGFYGHNYELVFSDEFDGKASNGLLVIGLSLTTPAFAEEGRTFYPGDDPYWYVCCPLSPSRAQNEPNDREAMDIHYAGTNDLERCQFPFERLRRLMAYDVSNRPSRNGLHS